MKTAPIIPISSAYSTVMRPSESHHFLHGNAFTSARYSDTRPSDAAFLSSRAGTSRKYVLLGRSRFRFLVSKLPWVPFVEVTPTVIPSREPPTYEMLENPKSDSSCETF